MSEKDIRRKIEKLQSEISDAKRALQSANDACETMLHAFLQELLAARESVPETQILPPPRLTKGSIESLHIQVNNDTIWNADEKAPAIETEFNSRIIYNPIKDTWHYSEDGRPSIECKDSADILDSYTDRLAAWFVKTYPGLRRQIELQEEDKRKAQGDIGKKDGSEDRPERSAWQKKQDKELGLIMMNIVLAIVRFLVVLHLFFAILNS